MWNRFNPEVLQKNEDILLSYTPQKVTREYIRLDDGNCIYSLQLGHENPQSLIIIHGLGGSGVIFYKIFNKLAKRYHVYCLDTLGMGRSSRPNFPYNTFDQCENFFADSLHNCITKLGIRDFILVGHSLGGYIAGVYATKYPELIQKIIFLSPAGIPEVDHKYDYFEMLKYLQPTARLMMFFIGKLWCFNITPVDILRNSGPLSGTFVKFYSKYKIKIQDKVERKALQKYLEQIQLLPGSSEYALVYVFRPGGHPIKPLCNRLVNLKIPMGFIYGDDDFFETRGAVYIQERVTQPVFISMLPNSGHHLYWDNPKQLGREILNLIHLLDNPV